MIKSDSDTVIEDVRIFDGEQVVEADGVLLSNGRIAEVGLGIRVPRTADVVEGRGGTLLPGLIDSHVHAQPVSLEQALVFGVTTELDMFSEPEVVQQLRMMAARGDDVADIRSSSVGVSATDGPLSTIFPGLPTLSGPEGAAAFVAARVDEGADYIKVYLEDPRGQTGRCGLSARAVRAVVQAAHAHGKIAIAHADSATMARLFVNAGGDALAHILGDLEPDPDLLGRLTTKGVFVVPTLRVTALYSSESASEMDAMRWELLDHPRLGPYLDPSTRHMLIDPSTFATVRAISAHDPNGRSRFDFEGARRSTGDLHRAGVSILAGTDVNPGDPNQKNPMLNAMVGHGIALHQELTLLVQAGLTPAEVLAAATSVPARCFGLTDRGRIVRGLRADLLLVDGDPTSDVTAIREIAGIWRRGARLDREAYRARLETDAVVSRQ